MKRRAVVSLLPLLPLIFTTAACAPNDATEATASSDDSAAPSSSSVRAVAPYLEELERELLFGNIWERPGLSKRDRTMITLAVTQGLYQPEEFGVYLRRALDEGMTTEEIAEVVTHVALYAGWPTGSAVSRVATEVYQERGLAFPDPSEAVSLEIDLRGGRPAYPVAPYLSALTSTLLYGDPDGVWARSGLSPRDRSMITVAVQQALYETQQLRGHIGRALNNGVTQDELVELITHVTFYAGWPTGSNAARVAEEVFTERGLRVRP
ncbi:MAG TPA: carboxymuconolactone decarboxylase family protein [Longimicrobiales bacterium]|nr:carboxymuconolactone decarboxylase family protein [Longimicrobiales bacterium]